DARLGDWRRQPFKAVERPELHLIKIVAASLGQRHAERSAAMAAIFVIVAANLVLVQEIEHTPKKQVLFRLAVSLVAANSVLLAPASQFTTVSQLHPRLAIEAHNEIVLRRPPDPAGRALRLGGRTRLCGLSQVLLSFQVVSHAIRTPV